MELLVRADEAEALYETLFDWQSPGSLWERSESLRMLLGDDLLATRDVGAMEIKKILEAWVTGKTFATLYDSEPCLVRLSRSPATDAQIYVQGRMRHVEVTQALYPGRKRHVFGRPFGGLAEPSPLMHHEQEAYEIYRDAFFRAAFAQVEARIERKFQLYPALDYLLVYVDLFDAHQPRFSYFALQEFAETCEDDLAARLQSRFRARWCDKIGHLFLLDDKPENNIMPFMTAPHAPLHASLSLA